MQGDFDGLFPLKAISFFCIHTGAVLHQLKGDTLCTSPLVNSSSVCQLTALRIRSAARSQSTAADLHYVLRVVRLGVAIAPN